MLMFMLQGSETLIVMSMLSVTRTRDVGRHDGDGSVDGADGDVTDDPRNHGGGGGAAAAGGGGGGESGDAFKVYCC